MADLEVASPADPASREDRAKLAPRLRSTALLLAVVAVAYVGAAKVGLLFASPGGNVTPFYPAIGLGVAAVMLGGRRLLPAVTVAEFAVDLGTNGSVAGSLLMALGSTLEVALVAWAMGRAGPRVAAFRTLRSVAVFAGSAAAGGFVAAVLGTAGVLVAGLAAPGQALATGATWMVGDAVGDAFLAPFVVLVLLRRASPAAGRSLELAAAFGAVATCGAVAFGVQAFGETPQPWLFLFLVPLAWAAFRLGPDGTAACSVLTAFLAVGATSLHPSDAAGLPDTADLLSIQLFTGTVSLVALAAAASVTERDAARRELELAYARAEREVRDRTFDLQATLMQVEQRERQLQQMTESISHVFWLMDVRTRRMVHVSTSYTRVTGHPREPLFENGDAWLDIVVPEDRARCADALVQLRQGSDVDLEFRIARPDGAVRLARCRQSLVRSPGQPDRVSGILEDVTERTRAERDLERFFTHTPALLCVADAEGRFLRLNTAWERTLGWSQADLLARPYIEFVHPDDRAGTSAAAQGLAEGKAVVGFQNRYRTRDGSYRWLLWDAWLVADRKEIHAVARDVTEVRRDQEALAAYRAALERSNRDLEQFAYASSHDLQEPLRTITGYAQLLEQEHAAGLDAEARQYIGRIVAAATRMRNLINDLLKYSRVTTAAKPLTPVHLEAVLQQALANLQASVDAQGALITHDPLPEVMGDEVQLIELLQNLIGNGLKFRREERPVIHVGVRSERDRWEVSVADNGIGIAPEHVARLFVPFQRLHARDAYPGTGIGLALCKRIVERHGGGIRIASVPGQGTTFLFDLPAAAAVAAAAPTEVSHHAPHVPTGHPPAG